MSEDRKGELGAWSIVYATTLVAAPFFALLVAISTFGLWGGGNPVSLEAIPIWLILAVPPAIGRSAGWRVAPMERSPRWVLLIGPAILSALAAWAGVNGAVAGDWGPVGLAALATGYTFGPVALGWGLWLVRAGRRQSPDAGSSPAPG